jgi:uroporphyrinogen-III decarboxylase
MTPRQRLLAALQREVLPDRVPISPDVSNMMPVRYTGKPPWEVYVNENPPMWRAHLELQRRFGYDMMIAIGLGAGPDDPPSEKRIIARSEEAWVVEEVIRTHRGDLSVRTVYPRGCSPWVVKPLVTDPESEVEALMVTLTDPWQKDVSQARTVQEAVGEGGIVYSGCAVPLAWWLYQRRQLDQGVLDFYDRSALVGKALAAYSEWALEMLRATCELLRPDVLMFGGSVASMSVVSPALYRRYALPFLCKAVEIARSYGVFTAVHICGRCRDALPMLAEAGVDMVEPLEAPPGGDVTLADVKREYGHRFCLKGNVNTFQTLARGTPEDVMAEAKRCIADAAAGGGFILSTGDQVPGDTPEENFVALIEAGLRYGVYGRAEHTAQCEPISTSRLHRDDMSTISH